MPHFYTWCSSRVAHFSLLALSVEAVGILRVTTKNLALHPPHHGLWPLVSSSSWHSRWSVSAFGSSSICCWYSKISFQHISSNDGAGSFWCFDYRIQSLSATICRTLVVTDDVIPDILWWVLPPVCILWCLLSLLTIYSTFLGVAGAPDTTSAYSWIHWHCLTFCFRRFFVLVLLCKGLLHLGSANCAATGGAHLLTLSFRWSDVFFWVDLIFSLWYSFCSSLLRSLNCFLNIYGLCIPFWSSSWILPFSSTSWILLFAALWRFLSFGHFCLLAAFLSSFKLLRMYSAFFLWASLLRCYRCLSGSLSFSWWIYRVVLLRVVLVHSTSELTMLLELFFLSFQGNLRHSVYSHQDITINDDMHLKKT